jgi:hypothetical protein
MAGEIDYQVFQDMLADPRLEAVKNEILDNKYRDLPEEVWALEDKPKFVFDGYKKRYPPNFIGPRPLDHRMKCPGSLCSECPALNPNHLIFQGDTNCIAGRKLWKKFKLLLSLKWEDRKHPSVAQLPLQELISSTKWYANFSFLIGVY